MLSRLILALSVFFAPTIASATEANQFSAHELYRQCKRSKSFCNAYVRAAVDTRLNFAGVIMYMSAQHGYPELLDAAVEMRSLCIPDQVKRSQLHKPVFELLEKLDQENNELLNSEAATIIYSILSRTYPCRGEDIENIRKGYTEIKELADKEMGRTSSSTEPSGNSLIDALTAELGKTPPTQNGQLSQTGEFRTTYEDDLWVVGFDPALRICMAFEAEFPTRLGYNVAVDDKFGFFSIGDTKFKYMELGQHYPAELTVGAKTWSGDWLARKSNAYGVNFLVQATPEIVGAVRASSSFHFKVDDVSYGPYSLKGSAIAIMETHKCVEQKWG